MSLLTHCKRGHEYTATNTKYTSAGARYCNDCRTELRRARVLAEKPSKPLTDLPGERWADVAGYNGRYRVSTHGRVMSLAHSWRPRLMKVNVNSEGYRAVSLSWDGDDAHFLVHRLVAAAFLERKPGQRLVRHLDDDPSNNHVSNLAWGTDYDNKQDELRNGGFYKSRQPACKSGHEWTAENTGWVTTQGNPYRYCRTCNRTRKAKAA